MGYLNLMKLSKAKCKVLDIIQECSTGCVCLVGSSSVERALGVLVDNKLSVSKQCCCDTDPTGQWDEPAPPAEIKDHYLVLLIACQATPGILHSLLVPTIQKFVGKLKGVQRRATKMIKGLGRLHMKKG